MPGSLYWTYPGSFDPTRHPKKLWIHPLTTGLARPNGPAS